MDRFVRLDARTAALDLIYVYQKTRDAHSCLRAGSTSERYSRLLNLRRESAKTCELLLPYTNVSPIPLSNGAGSESMA
jgi:hypothetical protein